MKRHTTAVLAGIMLWVPVSATSLLAQIISTPPYPPATNATLRRLDSLVAAAESRAGSDFAAYMTMQAAARTALWKLIEQDSLRTSADFLVASRVAGDSYFENQRVQYELALVAFVTDPVGSLNYVLKAWDVLCFTLGRGQRIGSFMSREGKFIKMEEPAPSTLRAIFLDMPAARQRAKGSANNAQMQAVWDEDQADRRRQPFDLARMAANDTVHRAALHKIVAQNGLVTAHDFYNAAYIVQHGDWFKDYALAHEFSIAAVALGDTSAVWLLAATYDRMLLDLGHRQRFGTQGSASAPGAVTALQAMDSTASNSRIRTTFGEVTSESPLLHSRRRR